jgi:hypothetical protein
MKATFLGRLALSAVTLVVLVPLLASASSTAEARITSLSGRVELQRSGERNTVWQRASVGSTLAEGDLVRTSEGSTATLRADDGSTFVIEASTLFQLRNDLAGSLASSTPADSLARPRAIPEERWFSLGPSAGIALAQPKRPDAPSLEGTLWLRTGGAWVRVQLTAPSANPYEVVPAR